MVRIDIFTKNSKYYFVPIYTADTLKKQLPNKAVVAKRAYDQWKVMDSTYEFKFSLYPNDLVRVVHKTGINAKKNNDEKIIVNDVLLYYNKAGINNAAICLTSHDKSYTVINLGILTLQLLEKYQVDILGNITKVVKETRQGYNKKRDKNEKYNRNKEE